MNDYLELKELYHHGIKGQRWGVRRYQNEDGTLTAEGKARYGVDANGKMSKEGLKLYNQDKRDQKTLDRSNSSNAIAAALKTGRKYAVTKLVISGAAYIAAKQMLKKGDVEKTKTLAAGTKIVNSILSTAEGIHMTVSAIKGANEKDKILKSQEGSK